MNTATVHATRTQSMLMKFPGGRFGYRYPRSLGAVEIVVGVWLVFLGILLLSQGYWWAVALLAVAPATNFSHASGASLQRAVGRPFPSLNSRSSLAPPTPG
jgi:hypothetical protein